MATAELAVALPVLVLLVLLGTGLLGAMRSGIECQNAARVGARLAARGEPPEEVRRAAAAVAPAGAEVTVNSSSAIGGDPVLVTVEVVARRSLAGPWTGPVPRVRVAGHAVALVEPNVG